MSLVSRIFRSSSLNVIDYIVKIASVFVVTPLMFSELGDARYGVWLLAMAIVGYFHLLDFGITLAGTRFLAREIGKGDRDKLQAYLSTLLKIYLRIGVAVIPLTLIVAGVIPNFFGEEKGGPLLRCIILAFGLNIASQFLTRIFRVLLRSHVRYDQIVICSLTKTVLQTILIVILLQKGFGIQALVVVHVSVDILDQFLIFLFARKINTETNITTRHYQPELVNEVLKYGFSMAALTLGNRLRTGVDPLIIGVFNGVDRIPVYSIGIRLLDTFSDLVGALFGGPFFAALSQIQGRGDDEALRDAFFKTTKVSAAIAMLGGSALVIYAPYFIESWIGPEYRESGTIVLILAFPYVAMLAQYPAYSLLQTTGWEWQLAALGFGGGLVNLTISLILFHWIGFFGIVWGTAAELSILCLVCIPILVSRSLNVSLVHYFRFFLPSFAMVGALSLVWYGLIRNYLEPNYFNLACFGAGHAILFFGLAWLVLLDSSHKRQILAAFKKFPLT